MSYKKILLEALSDSRKAKLADYAESAGLSRTEHSGKDLHNDVFEAHTGDKNAGHIVEPFDGGVQHHDRHNRVLIDHLTKHGYQIHDYAKNQAAIVKDTHVGQRISYPKITSALASTGGDAVMSEVTSPHTGKEMNLLEMYNADPRRTNSKKSGLQIVYDRTQEGVGGMSSGRSWDDTSCMRLPHTPKNDGDGEYVSGGAYHDKIQNDLHHGTICAYLTKHGDHKAESPLGRVLLKKFTNENGHSVFRPEHSTYGNTSSNFEHHVEKFASKAWPSEEGTTYYKHRALYDDGRDEYQPHEEIKYAHKEGSYGDMLNKHKEQYDKASRFVGESLNHHEYKENEKGELHSPDANTPSFASEHEASSLKLFHHNGLLHRNSKDGPSAIFTEGEQYKETQYHKNGKLSSPDHDLSIPSSHTENLDFSHKIWHQDGKESRDPKLGASTIIKTKNGRYDLEKQEFKVNGVHHNPYGYSMTNVHSVKGEPEEFQKESMIHGELHSINDQPSVHTYQKSDNVFGVHSEIKEWHTHGYLGRSDDTKPYRTSTQVARSGTGYDKTHTEKFNGFNPDTNMHRVLHKTTHSIRPETDKPYLSSVEEEHRHGTTGEQISTIKHYSPDGKLTAESTTGSFGNPVYIDSKKYHPNGKVSVVGRQNFMTTADKSMSTENKHYTEDGILHKKMYHHMHTDGSMHTEFTHYHPDGSVNPDKYHLSQEETHPLYDKSKPLHLEIDKQAGIHKEVWPEAKSDKGEK